MARDRAWDVVMSQISLVTFYLVIIGTQLCISMSLRKSEAGDHTTWAVDSPIPGRSMPAQHECDQPRQYLEPWSRLNYKRKPQDLT
jgi:hypothetical protein